MTYALALAVIIGAAAIAVGAGLLTQARIPAEFRRRHHEVGIAVFLQLGVIYAVLLAFVFSQTWSEYTTAAQAINAECAALHQAAMLARVLPDPVATQILRAQASYLRAVVDDEWPEMSRHRGRDPGAAGLFATLVEQTGRLSLSEPSGQRIAGQLLDRLAAAHDAREMRLFQVTSAVPPVLWWVLIAIGAVLVGFVAGAGVESRLMLGAMVGLFAAGVTSVLVMIAMLDFPFEGALALPRTDFVATLAKVEGLERAP